jgi:hypothetical protein
MKKSRHNSTARDALFEGPAQEYGLDNYQMMWWRVLYLAVSDAENLKNSNVTKRNQAKDAIRWLLRDQKDFEEVCLNAGVEPDWFRSRAEKYLFSRYSAELLGTVFAPRRRKTGR